MYAVRKESGIKLVFALFLMMTLQTNYESLMKCKYGQLDEIEWLKLEEMVH